MDFGWWVPYYTGTLKSFNVRSGYGFLECAETFDIYKTDVYIHKNNVPVPWHIGQTVEFMVHQNKHGQPQAQDCLWLPSHAAADEKAKEAKLDGSGAAVAAPFFFGTLKSYSSSQGYGFIASDEMLEQHACDVYLDRGQLPTSGQFRLGQAVEFQVGYTKRGQPQARFVNWDPVPQLPRPFRAIDASGPWVAESQGVKGFTRILTLLREGELTTAVKAAIELQESSEVVDYLSYTLDRLPPPSPEAVGQLEGPTLAALLMALSKLHRAHRLAGERVKANMSWCQVLASSLISQDVPEGSEEMSTGSAVNLIRSNLEVAAAVDENPAMYSSVLAELRHLAPAGGGLQGLSLIHI